MHTILSFGLSFLFILAPISDADKAQMIRWDERKLNWDDFSGNPPGKTRGDNVAQTSTIITLDPVDYQGEKVLVEINALFNKQESWVLPGNKVLDVLNHEQRHFDLSEYCARRLRSEIRNINNYEKVFNRITGECQRLQEQYDRETSHGTNKDRQEAWDRKIDRLLEEMKEFAGTRVLINR